LTKTTDLHQYRSVLITPASPQRRPVFLRRDPSPAARLSLLTAGGCRSATQAQKRISMNRKTMARMGLTGAGALALTLSVTLPAAADYAPQPNDVVGVGGDTPQFDVDFAANGDYKGDLGYNASSPVNRLVTFDATADSNARQAYAQGSTESAPVPLNPTVVLRAGSKPVQRVPSSGAAITALLNDTSSPEVINFVSSASEPTAAQQQQASTNGWGYLHVVQIAHDSVKVAAAKQTDAPAGLTGKELVKIYDGTYKKWNQIPGNSSASGNAIVPELPPSSSSITKTFLAKLQSANGDTPVTLAQSVVRVEQNDPTAINSADAIVPFSSARLKLYLKGYFQDPSQAFPGGGSVVPNAQLLTGKAPNGSASLSATVDHYIIFRNSDLASSTPFQPGGSLNWVQTLFSNPGGSKKPFVDTSVGQADIAAAGAVPAYADLGDTSSG
jgi:ABC-type phosphate transport system substrate-binding protein